MKLAYRQATEVHAGPDLQTHLKRMINGLDRLIADEDAEKERKRKKADEKADRTRIAKKGVKS